MMDCSNCGKEIKINDRYYVAGKNGTIFCSKECAYEAFEGYYTKQEVDSTIERLTRLK